MRQRAEPKRMELWVGAIAAGLLAASACLPPEEDEDSGESLSATGTSAATTTSAGTGIGFLDSTSGGYSNRFQCSIWNQTDCGEGQKCMPYIDDGGAAWNATRCVPIQPLAGAPGDACSAINSGGSGEDTCGAGAMCWGTDPETLQGICISFCEGSEANPTCADPSASCSIANDGALILCLPNCDPLIQDCSDPNDACYPIGEDFVCGTNASDPDLGNYGDPCEYINVCQTGLSCQDGSVVPGCTAIGCCTPFCDTTDPEAACPGEGTECVPFFEEGTAPRPELDSVGVCIIPA